jgi:AcrR family transcriptional regulator
MMPGARESLLDAADAALARKPWSRIRMVDVAAAAGVSRQTLYNEFGSKEGLARALVRRETDAYLAGVDRALALPAEPRERLAALAEWTVASAASRALVRAVLTGLWSRRLPAPTLSAVPSTSVVPAQRRADGPLPTPTDLFALVRDRAVHVLCGPTAARPDTVEQARLCELALRLALSCVLLPPGPEGAAQLIRAALPRWQRRNLP